MKNTWSKPLLIIFFSVLIIVALFLLPQDHKTANTSISTAGSVAFNLKSLEQKVTDMLPKDKALKLDGFKSTSDLAHYDSISALFDEVNQPGLAATYMEQKAKEDNTEKSFINAAYRYFDAFKMADDSIERNYFVQKAIETYSIVLKLNPDNLNAKTDLGICYADGTSNPMQGIALLREVIQKDPNHENAQLNLGFLSVKSGQYDKALERFQTVLKINPSRIDAYVFMGQTYLQMGKRDEAIKSFETFKSLTDNSKAIAEIDAYLKELKAAK
jgi:tetratricopeptide (TPR) repeat protein